MSERSVLPPSAINVLQVYRAGPTGPASVEALAATICKAVRVVVAEGNPQVECAVLRVGPDVAADPDWPALDRLLPAATVVHVHGCLSAEGLFLASQARLRGCRVVGSDDGHGEMPFAQTHKRMLAVYDRIQTQSAFAETAFAGFTVPVHRIPSPVDDDAFPPNSSASRDPGLLIGLGPVVPSAGFEAVIDALPPALRLVIAGPIEDAGYRQFLTERASGKSVHLAGDLDAASRCALIAGAGLYVQTSTHLTAMGEVVPKPDLSGSTALQCLSAGMPAVVSRSGALQELGSLPGCWVAPDGATLASLLERWASGTLERPSPEMIRNAVLERHGLVRFGRAYVDMVRSL